MNEMLDTVQHIDFLNFLLTRIEDEVTGKFVKVFIICYFFRSGATL